MYSMQQIFQRIMDRYRSGLCGAERDIPAEIMQNRLWLPYNILAWNVSYVSALYLLRIWISSMHPQLQYLWIYQAGPDHVRTQRVSEKGLLKTNLYVIITHRASTVFTNSLLLTLKLVRVSGVRSKILKRFRIRILQLKKKSIKTPYD
jgi:hypothetical protein